jgi:hypothetical protein
MIHTNGSLLGNLFPRERLPFPVNEELLRKLEMAIGANAPIWNGSESCFHQPPMMDFGEAAVCEWLNNIGMAMGVVYGLQHKRLAAVKCPLSPPLFSKNPTSSSLIARTTTNFREPILLTLDGLSSKPLQRCTNQTRV